ncbi:hypothetical protein Leryth_027310 [Lithospermum erythrorhizon]|nr:hypothetical protein Leryth_027310 [Lithospermum erythrorhizon]
MPEEIPAELMKMAPRKILALCGVAHELDLDKIHTPDFFDRATLAIQDHCIRNFQNWRDWKVLKIDKALIMRVSGLVYYLTFQAQNADCVYTFQGHVWETRFILFLLAM